MECFRQPSLSEKPCYPEPFRRDTSYEYIHDILANSRDAKPYHEYRARRPSVSIEIYDNLEEEEANEAVLKAYYNEVVVPLAASNKKGASVRGWKSDTTL
jgi:hypothetical protein